MTKKVDDNRDIKSLSTIEHILIRPNTYLGSIKPSHYSQWVFDENNKLVYKDLLYTEGAKKCITEIIDNSVDEFSQGFGDRIDIEIKDGRVKIRDYGRGIPLGKLEDCVSNVNTGAKYNNSVFKQAI